MKTTNKERLGGCSTVLGTKKWKDTNTKIVCRNKMEFEEKLTLHSQEKSLGISNSERYLREWEKPGDRKFAIGNDYKNAGAILN